MSATIANPEAAAETRDELLKQQRGGFAGVPDAEAVQHGNVKQRLEAKRKEAAEREINVLGEPVEFERPGAMAVKRAIDLRQRALNGDADAENDLFEYVFDLLADHSVDPAMDAEWWGGFGTATLMQVFESLTMGGVDEETKERIEQFRGE